MKNINYIIWLSMVFGNSTETVWKILKSYNSADKAYYEIVSGICPIKFTYNQNKNIKNISLDNANDIIIYCDKNKIKITCYLFSDYPKQFINLRYPPVVLYYRGDISCVNGKNITCVGTRQPSRYTIDVISAICTQLVENNFIIVSGFARGADITSHLIAVKMNRPTICVLGCGIDIDYPSGHAIYKEKIIESGGVLITEYSPLERFGRGNFHKRNILLASLSRATIVFEAKKTSGSLITANEAYNMGKKVLCIPPADILDERYAGNINILRSFAIPLYSMEDVFKVYNENNKINNTYIKNIPKAVSEIIQPEKPLNKAVPEHSFTPVQQKILDLLNNCTLHMDVIINKIDIDVAQLCLEIMELQQMGVIEEVAGNRFRKC